MQKNLGLVTDRRFWPLMVTMFCGCLNDCILKNALIILVIYKLASSEADFLVLLINSIFILPFIIFAGIAGQIADKYEKAKLIRIIKFAEIFIILLGLVGFYFSHMAILLLSITLMGIHSTFFGTLKLSIIPDQLEKGEFLMANGYIESATFIGVLIGTMLGSLYNWNQSFVMILMFLVALGGFISSLFILKSPNYDPHLVINANIFKGCANLMKYCYTKPKIFLSILAISWFWFMGASILSQIPILTKSIFGATEAVANLFMCVFSVGVGAGSILCSKLLRNKLSTKYIFASTIGMSILGMDLFFIIKDFSYNSNHLSDISTFLSELSNWHILLNLSLFSMLGGVYVVPLYSLLQSLSGSEERSRMIAANNLINAVFIMASAVLIATLFYIGCSISSVFLILSLLNLVVAGYIYAFLPAKEPIHITIIAKIIKFFLNIFYQVEVIGLDNFYKAGDRVVIACNHISYLDATLLSVYLPERPVFAINRVVAQRWWIKILLKLIKAHPVDNNNPLAIKNLIQEIKSKRKVAIFPEGRLSTTGKLMKTYAGPVVIAQKSQAKILPIIIKGPEHTLFATARSMPIKRLFFKVQMHILPPVEVPEFRAENKIKNMYSWLYEVMLNSSLSTTHYQTSLINQVAKAAKIYGKQYKIVEDISGSHFSYKSLISRSRFIANNIRSSSENICILLDNSMQSCCMLLGVQMSNHIPVMLDPREAKEDIKLIVSVIRELEIRELYTSKDFIQENNLNDALEHLADFVKLNYIEDIWQRFTFYKQAYYYNASYNSPRLIQSTSSPIKFATKNKITTIEQQNFLFNVNQVFSKLDCTIKDKILNPVPIFEPLGFQITMAALINGIKLLFYPSLQDVRLLPEIVYNTNVTIIFSTDTALNHYGQFAHSYDFSSVRYVFAYGQKLRSSTYQMWQDKFGIRILEMYSIKKAAGVVSFNNKLEYKKGSLGKILPGIEYKIVPTSNKKNRGIFYVKGKNIACDEWVNTGDVVEIDQDGYISLVGKNRVAIH